MAEAKLTPIQKKILCELYVLERFNRTFSWYVRYFSSRERLPESTVKWSIRSLRELALLRAGDSKRNGIPLKLTASGRIVAKYLMDNDKKTGKFSGAQ
ncbi:MAG TPA: hypothetical protein ENF82_04360 [Candidatus Methanomethylia archaeon]|nr:hypothetical protein [Candidatus Verstraetearchaeota archaeon]HDI47020.1 hypothetical protein [Candidatus Methanomethylicia archaeon]